MNARKIKIRSAEVKRRPLVRPVFLALIVIAAAVVPQVAKPEHGEGGAHDHHQHLEIAAAAMVPTAPKLPRNGWVATASSEESTADNAAARVLDGDRATIWHSRWRTAPSFPQWLTIDLRTAQRVSGLVYTPRPDHRNGLARVHAQRQVVDDFGAAVAGAQSLHAQHVSSPVPR